jgi:hypothetical protein
MGLARAGAALARFDKLLRAIGKHDGNAGVRISQRGDVRRLTPCAGKRLLPPGFGEVQALATTAATNETENLRRIEHASEASVGDTVAPAYSFGSSTATRFRMAVPPMAVACGESDGTPAAPSGVPRPLSPPSPVENWKEMPFAAARWRTCSKDFCSNGPATISVSSSQLSETELPRL